MDKMSSKIQCKMDAKTAYLDSKSSVDSTCSTRVNNSTDFSVYSSDSFESKTTNAPNMEHLTSGFEYNENTDSNYGSRNDTKMSNYGHEHDSSKGGSELSYPPIRSGYGTNQSGKVGFDAINPSMSSGKTSAGVLNKGEYGSKSPLSRTHEVNESLDVEKSLGDHESPVVRRASLDDIMESVNRSTYKVYEDDIMELEKCSKKMKYDDEDAYSQFDSNTSTANSDSNSVTDFVENVGVLRSNMRNGSRSAVNGGLNLEASRPKKKVFKDIFDPKNWDKSWTMYTKPKDRSAELVSELYVFMLQLKLLNSLELVRAVCRPWGVPPHGNDYVFHFDQIANCRDLSLLQKYEEVFAPLYGKFKAGSPSVLWTKLSDVDYFKIVFRLECIRFKQPFSPTIYENILRYTLSKLHASNEENAGSEGNTSGKGDSSPVGDLELLNNKNATDESSKKRTVCGVCGNVISRVCVYCSSMDSSPSNRVLINKVQVAKTKDEVKQVEGRVGAEEKDCGHEVWDSGNMGAVNASSVNSVSCSDDVAAGTSSLNHDHGGEGDDLVTAAADDSADHRDLGDAVSVKRQDSDVEVANGVQHVGDGYASSGAVAPSSGGVVESGSTGALPSVSSSSSSGVELSNAYGVSVSSDYSNSTNEYNGDGSECVLSREGGCVFNENKAYAGEGYGAGSDDVYDVSASGDFDVIDREEAPSVERFESSGVEGDEWPERRLSETDRFTLTSFNTGNEYESPNVYKEDLATSFKYSAPKLAEKSGLSGTSGAVVSKEGVYSMMGASQGESEDLTSNDNNTRLISSDQVDASELDVTTHSNVDFSEHFVDHTISADSGPGAEKGEGDVGEEERKLKEAMMRNSVFRESVLKTNIFKDNPLTEDMLKKLDQDYSYDSYHRGYQSHYKKGDHGSMRKSASNSRSDSVSRSLEASVSRTVRSDREDGLRGAETSGYVDKELRDREYLHHLSENYGLLDEEVLMRDEAIMASLDDDLVNSELTEDSYHHVSDHDIEKIVLSVLNRRLSRDYAKYDQNPLVALYGSKSENTSSALEGAGRSNGVEGYASKGDKSSLKRVKKKEDDYRNVDKYAYVENKYARMENRYNYMDYTPSYYTTSSAKEKRRPREMDYEFPSFSRPKAAKLSKLEKQDKAKKTEKQLKTPLPPKPESTKRKYELASPFKTHLANISRYYREGYYDDMMQPKSYGLNKDKEIKISSHVVSASVSYDKRQQRFMAQWKTREGTKHSKSFYAKRYASPIMARKHAELYKMYILQHRVMNASELVEPTYEQLLANNFKDLESVNVGELDYDL